MAKFLRLDGSASPHARQLATNVHERRVALQMSQAELSERTGIAASHLSHIERARANPTLATLDRLAAEFRCTVPDLLTCERSLR